MGYEVVIMTVKIPTHDKSITRGWSRHPPTTAWENFWNEGHPRLRLHDPAVFAKLCSEWRATWNPVEGVVMFDNKEDAVMWVMRWS